jgi:hypothetical protein
MLTPVAVPTKRCQDALTVLPTSKYVTMMALMAAQ